MIPRNIHRITALNNIIALCNHAGHDAMEHTLFNGTFMVCRNIHREMEHSLCDVTFTV